jgi:NADPH-dependent 2,4-dienoyl-CoA reductase/sulfur reductase-like enzyme
VLVDADPGLPYDRPPLSKGMLEDGGPVERPLLRPEAFYAEQDIELVLGRAVYEVDTRRRFLRLTDGERIGYGRLVIACGLEARRPAFPGADLPGVHLLRSFGDALALRGSLDRASRVLVIGAGFVGAEVASAARSRGLEVTVVELASHPMARVLPAGVAESAAAVLADAGVVLRTGLTVASLEGADRVARARLSDGSALEADLVVVGVGTAAALPLMDGCDLTTGGIEVDAQLRTSFPHVYAIGDVALTRSTADALVRTEQWTNAVEQGLHLGGTLAAGTATPYSRAPYAWSQQFGHMIQIAGRLTDGQRTLKVADGGRHLTLAGDSSSLIGAFGIDLPVAVTRARRLIEERAPWADAVGELRSAAAGQAAAAGTPSSMARR